MGATNAIPAFQLAMFHPDLLISLVDGWTLTVQMREYFEAGSGRDLFGPQQPLAVRTSRTLETATDTAVADVLAAERLGGLSTLGSMAEMAQDAQQMALVFASYMPKEVRWQSELLIASLTDSLRFNSLLAAIERMEVLEETTRFLRETPAWSPASAWRYSVRSIRSASKLWAKSTGNG